MSGSTELPLWNEDETDVRPAYQLTYGHSLIAVKTSPEKLLSSLGFRIIDLTLGVTDLPRDETGRQVFTSGNDYHFLIVDQTVQIAVFGDRTLFFNNRPWIDLSKSHRTRVAVVTRTDEAAYFFSVFNDGELTCYASWEGNRLRFIRGSTVHVYLDGDKVHSGILTPTSFNKDELELVAYDVAICAHEDEIRFSYRRGGELIPRHKVRHFRAVRERRRGQ